MKKIKLNSKQRAIQRSLIIATAAFTCLALPANDQDKQTGQKPAYGQEQHGDKAAKFIQEALAGSQMEVKMGQLGQQKAQNAEVKRLAERLVQDHQAASQELQQLAQGKNLQVAADHGKHQGQMTKLENASGAEFDKEFVKHTIKDHKKDISKFEKCSKDVNDAQLKAFIDKTLPKLREHLQMAQAAATSVGLSQADLTALETEDATGAGAPAGAVTESEKGADTDQANENKEREQIKLESKDQGASPEIESSTQSSSDDPSLSSSAQINTDDSGFDAATQTDSSLTINQNTPATDSAAAIDPGATLDADVDIEADDADASIRSDLDTDKNDGKILGIENQEGDGKTLGVTTVPGDGKTLGLDTSKNDGKLLGIIPWRDGDKSADADVDVDVDADDTGVSAEAEVDTEAVGGPAASTIGKGSSERVEFNQLPETVKSTLRAQGADNNSNIKRMTVYEVNVNGKKMYVHEDGTTHHASEASNPTR